MAVDNTTKCFEIPSAITIIMTNQSPQLPEFNDSDLIRVNTEHHSVEIEKSEMAKVIAFCRENHITQDYYMFEFMTWEHEV